MKRCRITLQINRIVPVFIHRGHFSIVFCMLANDLLSLMFVHRIGRSAGSVIRERLRDKFKRNLDEILSDGLLQEIFPSYAEFVVECRKIFPLIVNL